MNRKWALILVVAALLLGAGTQGVEAGSTATQTVTLAVRAINEIAVSGNPGSLVISAASAGSDPVSVSDASTTYSITTNESGKQITAHLNEALPTGVSLGIALQAPGSANSSPVTLTQTAAAVVTGLTPVVASDLVITYTLSATVDAGVLPTTSRIVTLTVTENP